MKATSPRLLTFPVPAWLCALVVLVAWIGGSLSEYNSAAAPGQVAENKPGNPDQLKSVASTEASAVEGQVLDPSANPSEGAAGIAFAAAQTPGLARLEAFQQALRGINADNWMDVAKTANRARTEGLIAEMEEWWIYQRIGEIAGASAAKLFEPKEMGGIFERGGMSNLKGWASKDPDAAWTYVESLRESPPWFKSMVTEGFVRAAMEKDTSLAQQALATMPSADQARFLTRMLGGPTPGAFSNLAESWLKENASNDAPETSAAKGSVFAGLLRQRFNRGAEYAGSEDMAAWLASYSDKSFALTESIRWTIQAQNGRDPARTISLVKALVPADQPISSPVGWNIVADSVGKLIATDRDAGHRWITEHRDSPYYGPAVYALIVQEGAGMTDEVVQSWMQNVDEQTQKRISDWRQKQKSARQ